MALVNKKGYIKTGKTADGADIFASDPGVGGWIQGFAAPVTNFIGSVTAKPDTSVFQTEIDRVKNTDFDTSSNNALLASIDNMKQADTDYSIKDLGFNIWSELGNDLMQGVGTVASTGNIWAGAASLVTGLTDTGIKAFNYNREAKSLEDQAKLANATQQANAISAVNTVDNNNDRSRKMSVLADGGNLMTPNILTEVNAGGTHEQNPYGGVPMGVDDEGKINSVEEGEVLFEDYVYSNRIKVPKALKDKYKIKEDSITFADAVKQLIEPYKETMNDPISKREIESIMSEFTQAQEDIRMKKNIKNKQNKFLSGGLLRAAPILANTAGLMQNYLTPLDYVYANKIENAVETPTAINPILLTSRYDPQLMDINYLVNKGKAQAAATRNALLQTSNNAGAAGTNLLAQEYATQGALADISLKGLEANEAKKLQKAQFDLGVEQYNAEALTKAAKDNAEDERAANQLYLQGLTQAAQMKMAKDQAKAQAIGINLNALADNAYQLYRDDVSDAQVAFYNSFSPYLNEEGQNLFKRYKLTGELPTKEGKNGGKLIKRKRKGLTY